MFNRVSKLSKKTFATDASPSTGDLDAGSIEPFLADAEVVQYVLASSEGIEHAMEDRTTTIEPGSDSFAYGVVTDRRIYFLLGEAPSEPELSVDLEEISKADLRDSLLSATLVVATGSESVRFVPADGETATEAASYISRIGAAWSNLFEALENARGALSTVESAVENDEDAKHAIQQARSRLSNAHHCATHQDDAPTELMRAEIEPIEAELERLRVDGRLDRIETLLEAGSDARDDGDFEEAVETVVELAELVETVEQVLDDVEAPAASETLTSHEETLACLATSLMTEAENACHRGLDADDPAAVVTAWDEALERYRSAISAEWDGPADTTLDALRFQLAWVVGNLIDALAARSEARETEADELEPDDDEAVERYEAAKADVERARALANDHPHATGDAFVDSLGRLEEKIERAEWQWGAAD